MKFLTVPPKNIPEDYAASFLVNNIGASLALLVHLSWFVIFWKKGPEELALLNVLSVLLFSIVVYANRKGHPLTSIILIQLEVPIHAVFAVSQLGTGLGFEYFCFVMFFYPFTFQKGSMWLRSSFAVLSLIGLLICVFAFEIQTPPNSWSTNFKDAILISNITSSGFFISLFAALFYQTFTRNEQTLKKRTTELILAKEFAESSQKAKETFLANMSHEMRTPLNAIMGYAEVLSFTRLTDDQQKHLKTINTASNNLLLVINDLLDLANIENESFSLKKSDFNIHQTVNETIELQAIAAKEKEIELLTDLSNLTDINISGDATRLTQILTNLISNAIKFTEKGHILVECWNTQKDPNVIHFAVEDTGIGIAESNLKVIFERFTQVETNKKKSNGTGLGLHISKKLVELHHGELHVRSKPNSGSRFEFFLEYDTQGPQLQTNNKAVHESRLSGHVLIVEDNEQNQVLAHHFLEKMGLHTTIVNDGKEALKICEQVSFDCILMDLEMPNMNGYEATETMRQIGNKTPIIACTAHSLKQEKEKCLESGMNGYVSKPYSYESLLRVIEKELLKTT